jgi:hypothetical protein
MNWVYEFTATGLKLLMILYGDSPVIRGRVLLYSNCRCGRMLPSNEVIQQLVVVP